MSAALAVFVIGLRHGADPDHLAAIDNLTRNAYDRMPRASRYVGTFFALGHSAMVLATAALASLLGSKMGHASAPVERIGALLSIGMLILMAVFNIIALLRGSAPARARLLPRALREATHPLVAVPIGALFGLGFETSSQLVAFGLAFSSGRLIEGLAVGGAFCLGMICTDTIDSRLVARVVGTTGTDVRRARRTWIIAVTLVALAVALQQTLQFLGVTPLVDELTLSIASVVLLIGAALVIAFHARVSRSGTHR